MARMRPPAVPEQPVPVLTDDDLRALLATCAGRSFEGRRDTALLRMLLDTGVRAAEVTNLAVDDVDFDQGVAHVLGQGPRRRSAPFGLRTSEALRHYLRVRRPPARRRTGGVVAAGERCVDGIGGGADPQATGRPGRRAAPWASAPVPPHLRPQLAGGRRPGAGLDATGGVAVARDGRPLRRQRSRRAGPGCPLPAGAWGPAVRRGPR